MHLNKTFPYVELGFKYANEGTLYGVKIEELRFAPPRQFPQLMLVNERFPDLAQDAYNNMASKPPNDPWSLRAQMLMSDIYSLIFFDVDM